MDENKPSTTSDGTQRFKNLENISSPVYRNLTIDDVVNYTTKLPKDEFSYVAPRTYIRRGGREQEKESLSPEGAVYSFPKAKRDHFIKPLTFGKDGKEPPHSYLNVSGWIHKNSLKNEGKSPSKISRKTYIDEIMDYNHKYKIPGPEHYFTDSNTKKDSTKKELSVNPHKLQKPSFLDEIQYHALNIPAPGAYPTKALFQNSSKASKEKINKSFTYVPGGWKTKNDQKRGPGDYEITRMFSIVKDEKGERLRALPTLARTVLGVIAKPAHTKRLSVAPRIDLSPASYYKTLQDVETSFRKISRPMRRYQSKH